MAAAEGSDPRRPIPQGDDITFGKGGLAYQTGKQVERALRVFGRYVQRDLGFFDAHLDPELGRHLFERGGELLGRHAGRAAAQRPCQHLRGPLPRVVRRARTDKGTQRDQRHRMVLDDIGGQLVGKRQPERLGIRPLEAGRRQIHLPRVGVVLRPSGGEAEQEGGEEENTRPGSMFGRFGYRARAHQNPSVLATSVSGGLTTPTIRFSGTK